MLRVIVEVVRDLPQKTPNNQSAAFSTVEKSQQHWSQAEGLLATTWEWQLTVAKVNSSISQRTWWWPHIIVMSETMTHVVLLELAIPWEEQMAFKRKMGYV